MKMRNTWVGIAVAAALYVAPANAQVLGGGLTGGLGGGLGGTLSGGMSDIGVMGNGAANGSLDSDFATGSLRRGSRDVIDGTKDRVRDTSGRVKERAQSRVDQAQGTAANTTSSASQATSALNDQHLDAAANTAVSMTSEVASDGAQVSNAVEGAIDQTAELQPQVDQPLGDEAMQTPDSANLLPRSTDVEGTPVGAEQQGNLLGLPHGDESQESSAAPSLLTNTVPNRTESENHVLDGGDANHARASATPTANGSASGDATGPKRNVSAQSSASAQGSGTANVAMSR